MKLFLCTLVSITAISVNAMNKCPGFIAQQNNQFSTIKTTHSPLCPNCRFLPNFQNELEFFEKIQNLSGQDPNGFFDVLNKFLKEKKYFIFRNLINFELASCYEKGHGTKKDIKAAITLYTNVSSNTTNNNLKILADKKILELQSGDKS